ncbi:MAG: STAS domain-containing protein [Phycisphaerales bacterium JB040]
MKLFGKSRSSDDAPLEGPVILETTHCRVIDAGGVAVATLLTPKVSEHESTPLTNELNQAAGKTGSNLIVDLSQVTMLASAGIGMLVQIHNGCKAAGGRLAVAGLDPDIRQMLEMTRMDKLLDLQDTPADARARFK